MSDVQVTQEDRDAASNYIEPLNGHILAANIRLGLVDGHMAAQAFARHRLATRPALDVEGLRGQLRVLQESHEWLYREKERLENALKDIASRASAHLSKPAIKDATDAGA